VPSLSYSKVIQFAVAVVDLLRTARLSVRSPKCHTRRVRGSVTV